MVALRLEEDLPLPKVFWIITGVSHARPVAFPSYAQAGIHRLRRPCRLEQLGLTFLQVGGIRVLLRRKVIRAVARAVPCSLRRKTGRR